MANSLLDILNEALRVSNGRGTSQPARTLASAPTQPAQARPDIYVRNNQPRRPARRRSLWSRGFDQLNPFDNNLTWKQETPTQTKSAFQQLGQAGGQLARGAVTVPTQIVNSTAEFAGDTVDLGRAGVAGLTNNKAAMNAALNRGLASRYSAKGQGILGTGGLITSEKAQKPIPAGDLTKTIVGKGVQGYAEVASLGAGGFAGKQLVQQGFKQGIRSQVPVLVKTGALNAVQGGADTYNQGGSAKDVLKSAAINTVIGTAADVGLGVAGAATTKLVKSGLNAAPTKPVFADFAPKQDPLESLKQEARKYKSAEEFDKSLYGKDGKAWLDYNKRYDFGNPYDAKSKSEFDLRSSGHLFESSGDYVRLQDAIKGHKKVAFADNQSYDPVFAEIAKRNGLYTEVHNGSTYVGKNKADVQKYIKGGGRLRPDQEFDLIGYKPERFTDLYNQATQSQPPKSPIGSLKQEARKEYDFFSNSKYFADNDNVIKTLAELNDKSTPTYQALDLLRQERGLGGVEKNLIEISKRTDATNKQTAQAKQVAKKDLDGFTEGKSALQRGKIEKTLDSQIRYNGQVMSKRDYIRKLVNDGYVPDEKTGSIYSPNDRSNYQAVTKTEADYARHLYKDKTNSIESLKQEAKKIDYEPINKAQDEAKSFMTQMIDKYQPQKQGRSMKITDMMSKSEKAQMNKLNKAADDLYNQATQSQPPKTTLKKDPLESLKQEARKLDEQVRSYDMKKNFKGFRESDDARKLVELESKLQESNNTISRLENPVDKVTVSQIENMGRKAILEGNVSKADLVKQFNKMGKEKFPSNQKRYIDDTYGSVEAYYDDVIAKGEAGVVENFSQLAGVPTSPQFEDFYSRTVLNRNKTGLNGNEPKINKVERKITETEPKRTEKATQSQPPKTTLKKDPLNEVFQNNPVNGVNSRLQAKNISQEQALRQVPDYSKLTNEDAARPAEFNAVAATAGSKNAKKLEQQLVSDKRITDKLKEAQISGQEVNFYAKKDPNGRSVGIQQFDPTQHRIESGFVVDSNGKVLGNHIKVDETGVQVNVGGDIVNMDAVIGNPTDWAGSYRVMETMDRNIKRNAPDEATYRKTREFLIDNKIKNEANFREELKARRTSLGRQAQDVQSVRPSGVSKDEFNSDVFDFIEGKMSNVDIKAKYGDGAKAIIDYKATTRKVYDDLLDRVNEVFAKYGEAPVLKRKDYITHINELNNKPNFAGEMFGQLQNSFLGEGMQSTRKGVPGEIAGRTETFEPRKRWNRFFQQRKGGEFSKDPFKAVDAYLEPTLYNIHMTESSVRARAIESAFRTADEIRNMDKNTVSKTLSDELDKYHNGDNAKLITGFQEFANALAGKTQRLDRQIIDTSKGAELGLRGWQQLQRIGGRGTILGNAQSVLSQTLGQPLALADTGMKNYLKGVASSLTGNTPINQSAFIKARSTKVTSPFRSTGTKILDAGGVPLEKVELAMVKNTWNAEYHKAVEKGFKGKKAILEADRTTEQVVAGRGIADQPEAYRSTAANGFLQYTLEVAANNKKFWQDLSPSQKATYVAVVFGANTAFGLVTGYEPLPDFLGATIDTAQDFNDPNDTRTGVQKAVGGAQRYASESVEMNPLATAGVNTLLNQDQRKAVFGQDSSLSRFEGTAAPVQVIRNTADAAINLTKGRYGKAASSAVKNLPFGNQTNKTVTGAAMINRGYAVDSAGNPTFPAPTDAVGRAQALLFGPNSTKAAQNFYSNNQGSVSGKTDLATLNASSNKSKTLAEIQQRRLSDNKIDKAVDERVKKVLPDAEQSLRNNPAFSKLSPEDQVKKLTKLTDDIRAVEKRKYMADNKVGEYANDFKGKESKLTKSQRDLLTNGVDTAKYTKSSDVGELPAGMNGYDVQTLERFAGLSDTEADDIIRKEKDAEYKLTLAKYERDKKLGKISKVEDLKRSKELKRAKAGSDFEKEIREFYTLNKGEINNYVSSSPDGKTVAEKLLAYDDALVAAGVIEKNKFRDKYGNPKFDTKTSGSGKSKKGKKGKKGGKGRKGSTKGRYDYKLFAFKTPKNTQKSLRELVKKATL